MMKIDKHVPLPEPIAECKTAFVKDMKVGDSVLIKSGGYTGKEARRILSAMRHNGYASTSRTESGYGKNATIRVWRIAGSLPKGGPSKKVAKHTKAGKRGKIIQCPECAHRMVMSNFAWSKIVCLGCRAEIKKTDCVLPKLSKRQEAKVRTTYEAEQFLDVDTPVELECEKHGDRVQQFCELKAENWGGSLKETRIIVNALHTLLKAGNGQLASQIGKMSYEGVVQLANDTRLDGLLRGKTNEHPIK